MEVVESNQNDLNSKMFPLCKTLKNLYFALLQASLYSNKKEYNIFDIKDRKSAAETRSKALAVFSEFDITGYALGASKIIPFHPPLNSSVYVKMNFKKIKNFIFRLEENHNFSIGQFDECKCTVPIKHKFEVKNRFTQKKMFPVGNICIMKFSDTNTLKIMKSVSKIIMISSACTLIYQCT